MLRVLTAVLVVCGTTAQASALLSLVPAVVGGVSGPSISLITPTTGPTEGGTTVTVIGSSFGTSRGTVTIGGLDAGVSLWGDTTAIVSVPPGPGGSFPLVLNTTTGGVSNAVTFTYSPPILASIVPDHGPTAGGTVVTLSGSSFGTSGTVTIGGTDAGVVSWTHTAVIARTPAGAGLDQLVQLSRAGETSSSVLFSYDGPVINSVFPVSGPTAGGTQITLSGLNFGPAGTVTIDGSPASPVDGGWSHGAVVVLSPPGAGGSNLQVVLTTGGQSALASYSNDPPSLGSVLPQGGPTAGGVTLTLTGNNFGTGSRTSVTVGGRACLALPSSHTRLTCTMPEGEGTGLSVVVLVAGASTSSPYAYGAPVLSLVSPTQLPADGGTLDLTGTNLGLDPVVTVGGVSCQVGTHSHQAVQCTAPPGQGTVDLVLTAGGQASNALRVTYPPALGLTSLFPTAAPTRGGTALHLEGTGLAGAVFEVAGAACPVLEATDTSAVCVLPATPAGPATVVARAAGAMALLTGLEFFRTCGADLADGAPCDNGTGCTGAGSCLAGRCQPGGARNEGGACDDGNACTGAGQCAHGVCVGTAASDGGACVGASACTGVGTCTAGVCASATPTREGLVCDDGQAGTIQDHCAAGVCVGVAAQVDGGDVDAGLTDAGSGSDGGSDAGARSDADGGGPSGDGGVTPGVEGSGCGCGSTPGGAWLALAFFALSRRVGPWLKRGR